MYDEFQDYINQRVKELSLDIPKPKIIPSESTPHRLVIGYDKSLGCDGSCLVVAKQYDGIDTIFVVNEFTNEKADELYRYLTTPNSPNPFQNSFNEKV